MELRSERRLGSLPTPQPRRRRRPPCVSDRISALPDEMLHQILVRLRCARTVAYTSGVSRRWRGLWRHLPELSFRDISADALEAALGQVACPALSLLEVDMPEKHRVLDPARVAALLRAAARLAPADLVFRLWGHIKDRDVPIEIPCFERATSVKLNLVSLYLRLPAGGAGFPHLERLSVAGYQCDTPELVLRCPRLRVLEVSRSGLGQGRVKVHSPTVEELVVNGNPSDVDIKAPVLKRLSLSVTTDEHFTVSFSAPMVENLSWHCSCFIPYVGFGDNWLLRELKLRKNGNVCVLHMFIAAYFRNVTPPAMRSFSEEIARLPAFYVLELDLLTEKHHFEALVSHLLGICSTIKSLKMHIGKTRENETCSPNCPCDQPPNWRHEIISMRGLEEVTITGFGGTDHEVDFLKLLFRCAASMKSMTMVWAPKFSPTAGDCEDIFSIFEANPDVKCTIYHSPSKE